MVADEDSIRKTINDQREQKMTQKHTHKRRLFVLDIMRILCALLVYLRHSITMYGCTYGHFFDAIFTLMTSPVMTCFFMLSGFSIQYQHRQEEMDAPWVRTFLKKRFIGIMPSYLIVVAVWPLVHPDQAKDWALLLPVDIFGIQTSYRTLFGILHNGGTWFVSCMLLAYLIYPIIKGVISSGKLWIQMTLVIVLHFILMYSNVVITQFSLDSLYSNPIARTAEFAIGVVFAEMVFSNSENTQERKTKAIAFPALSIAALTVISVLISLLSNSGLRMMVLSYLVIPVVLILFLVSSILHWEIIEKSKILSALSGMSYQFFLMQLFLWDLTAVVLGVLNLSDNAIKIVTSFVLCTVLSYIVFRFIDKPVRKSLTRKLIKADP